MAIESWRWRDPSVVYERIEAQERARAARSRQGKAEKAKAGLEDLFTGEGMGRKLEIDAHIRAALCQWGRWANRPQFWANLNVTPFCKLVGIGAGRDTPDIALDPQSLHIHKAMMRMKCRVTMVVLIGYYVGNASWDDQAELYTKYGISRKAFYEVLRSGSIALFNAAKLV